jgi:hypothetical protein
MDRDALMRDVERLGREFARRGMKEHARSLRLYWLALKNGLTDAKGVVNLQASPDWVSEWNGLLRLPGAEGHYPVLPAGAPCPECGPLAGREGIYAARTLRVLPDGALMVCDECKAQWLVLDRTSQES